MDGRNLESHGTCYRDTSNIWTKLDGVVIVNVEARDRAPCNKVVVKNFVFILPKTTSSTSSKCVSSRSGTRCEDQLLFLPWRKSLFCCSPCSIAIYRTGGERGFISRCDAFVKNILRMCQTHGCTSKERHGRKWNHFVLETMGQQKFLIYQTRWPEM